MSTSLHRDGFMRMPGGYALFSVIDSGMAFPRITASSKPTALSGRRSDFAI